MNRFLKIFPLMTLLTSSVFAGDTLVNPLEKGLTFNLSNDGKYGVKIGASAELWMRGAQMNPGTKDLSGKKLDYDMDFVLRRVLASTMVKMDRFLLYTLMGPNTFTYTTSVSPYTSTKPLFYLYDAFGSYAAIPEYLRVGYGLSLYRGLSRYSSASGGRSLGADVPMLAAPDVITTDQTARRLGFFATGNIGRLAYRANAGKPFAVNASNRPSLGINKAADAPNSNYSTEGYFAWQFFEKESSPLPFTTGTYVGKKKVCNLGAGVSYHPESTQSLGEDGDTVTHDKLHLAVDFFLDLPTSGGGALTFYAAYFRYNYGPNYFMNGGTANVYSATGGISEPGFGTGNAVASQLAWLFPQTIGASGRIQVYYEGDYRFYEALDDAALHHNVGITYFHLAHNLKFTLQHELRPYFKGKEFDSYKSMVVLKSQFSF